MGSAVIDVFRLARVQRNYYEIAFGCELTFFSFCEQMIRLLRARHSSLVKIVKWNVALVRAEWRRQQVHGEHLVRCLIALESRFGSSQPNSTIKNVSHVMI
jgi:hypothetical protein